ncbi:hypothetical protein K402DRAFT_161002 [Aulographum hederae CBS 113979]|uniref:Uncharacterized protein n=1 Tax=Aulographum hederae CBS 113979 TaxID=1176131 RepID=A0A6G1GSG9_9PEZI|nr:hypothetical protein K402DRAFT_161002 [Aulographum hederae CBS 113979]
MLLSSLSPHQVHNVDNMAAIRAFFPETVLFQPSWAISSTPSVDDRFLAYISSNVYRRLVHGFGPRFFTSSQPYRRSCMSPHMRYHAVGALFGCHSERERTSLTDAQVAFRDPRSVQVVCEAFFTSCLLAIANLDSFGSGPVGGLQYLLA